MASNERPHIFITIHNDGIEFVRLIFGTSRWCDSCWYFFDQSFVFIVDGVRVYILGWRYLMVSELTAGYGDSVISVECGNWI